MSGTPDNQSRGGVEHIDVAALRRQQCRRWGAAIGSAVVLVGVVVLAWPAAPPSERSPDGVAGAPTDAAPDYAVVHASWRRGGPAAAEVHDGDSDPDPSATTVLWGDENERRLHEELARRYDNLDIMVVPR